MSTKIEWTQETWNPVVGCSKVSEGCRNCYAETMARRLKGMGLPQYQDVVDERGWTGKIATVPDALEKPLRWRKPRRVFVGSMTDLFHEKVPTNYIGAVLGKMAECPQHTFQILTKRPRRMEELLGFWWGPEVSRGLLNHVWLGVTVENQKAAGERIPYLLQTPAAMRFVSVEPMLGSVDLELHLGDCADCGNFGSFEMGFNRPGTGTDLCLACGKDYGPGLDWVIIGCESGPKRRPCRLEWVRDLVRQCKAAGIAVFVKQLDIDGRVSKDPAEWPEDLRVREYPL